MNYTIVNCPHCNEYIFVYLKELNCHIFRHGILKNSNKQMEPHLKKEECDRLFNEKKIYGCGKPFKIKLFQNKKYLAEKCEYI
jgi:hypothetical protein